MTGITGLHNGDRIEVVHPEVTASATYVGYAGGPTALVKLAGTLALVHVPREWIRRAS